MPVSKALTSSKSDDWFTPQVVLDAVYEFGDIALDPCSNPKCIVEATADAICFWRGRIRFLGAPASAPFPSALVYWGDRRARFARVFGKV